MYNIIKENFDVLRRALHLFNRRCECQKTDIELKIHCLLSFDINSGEAITHWEVITVSNTFGIKKFIGEPLQVTQSTITYMRELLNGLVQTLAANVEMWFSDIDLTIAKDEIYEIYKQLDKWTHENES